jgi:hypothetical protein
VAGIDKRGTQPQWARKGQEPFYESICASMRVSPTSSSTFAAEPPSKLFDTPGFFNPAVPGRQRDIAPDGQRFLMIKEGGGDQTTTPPQIIVVQNWHEELKRLVPTK